MAYIDLTCTNQTGPNVRKKGRVRVNYNSGGGNVTVTSIQGYRTDGYRSYGNSSSNRITVTVGGVSSGSVGCSRIGFGANWSPENWSAFSRSYGVSGNVNITVHVDYCNNADISGSNWSGTISAGYPAPVSNSVTTRSVGRTSAVVYCNSYDLKGASITDGGWDYGTNTSSWSYIAGSPLGDKTLSNLTPNTKYYYRNYIATAGGGVNSPWNSFTTTGNAPTITRITATPLRTSCSINISVSYDTNASFKSRKINYGISTSYGLTSSDTNLTNLQPNTTYYYSITVTDNWGRTSTAKTGSFKTTCNKPSELSIVRTMSEINSITGTVSASGDINAPVTNYTLYYKKENDETYINKSLGSNVDWSLTSLDIDTNYQIYFTASNAGGVSTSEIAVFSTMLVKPNIDTLTPTDITPFSCKVIVNSSIEPERELLYSFSKDDGVTWSNYQADNHYVWSNLTEETTYKIIAKVKATHLGINSEDTIIVSPTLLVTTLADQAKIMIKNNDGWLKGKVFYKKDGVWIKVKKVYIKKDGHWIVNQNNN